MTDPLHKTTDEALPCPHCGTPPLRCYIPPHSHGETVRAFMPDHPGSYTIECPACSAGMVDSTRDGVLARWNRRTGK